MIAVLLSAALAGGCRSGADASVRSENCTYVEEGYGPSENTPIRIEVIATGLEVPWSLAMLPSGDLLVTERPGRLRLIRDGVLLPDPVLNVHIATNGEGGLLGLVTHPRFLENRFLYLYYTSNDGQRSRNRVERWRLADNGLAATLDRIVLDGIPAAAYHDGGRMHFGPDNMLYVGTGDAGDPSSSQDVTSPAGKILRLTDDGQIPADNPWKGRAAFVMGIRNTQGFDWQDTSTLLVSDHGPSGELGRHGHDELSAARAGQNLGWPTVYGCSERPGLLAPILTWKSAVPPGGAAIYRGDEFLQWRGSLILGTLGSQHLHRVVIKPGTPPTVARHHVLTIGTFGRLRDVYMAPDGHLYVTTSNCDGRGTCPADKDRILRLRHP